MNPSIDREAKLALAQEKLAARRLRLKRVRSGSVAGAVAAFVLAWGVIFGQMAVGNDPGLASTSSSSSGTTTTESTTTTENTTTSGDSTLVEATPVTTSQS